MTDAKEINRKFFEKSLRPDRQRSYHIVVKTIKDLFDPQSLIDYGCGAGWILHYAKQAGISDVIGIELNTDANFVASEEVKDIIEYLDLTQPIYKPRKYDVAVSFEVVEHIEEQYANIVIENICRNVSTVVFSAATPGQGGYGHVNEQPHEYWHQKFAENGFSIEPRLSKLIRDEWTKEKIAPWFGNNSYVFVRL